MLVLSRKKGESIVIGDWEIILTVVDIRGDKVRIGVDTDSSISVDRKEVRVSKDRDRRDMERGGLWPSA